VSTLLLVEYLLWACLPRHSLAMGLYVTIFYLDFVQTTTSTTVPAAAAAATTAATSSYTSGMTWSWFGIKVTMFL
jgi:hypothetical protein